MHKNMESSNFYWKAGVTEMANVRDAVNAVIAAIMAQKDYLTALDAKTGDGDHGLNMARGFTAAQERLAELPGDAPVQDVLHHIGRAFIENVGGAAGPLYGIAFVRAGEAVNAKTRLDVARFEKLFTAGIEAIQRRGRAGGVYEDDRRAARTSRHHRRAQHRRRGPGRDELSHHVPRPLQLSARLMILEFGGKQLDKHGDSYPFRAQSYGLYAHRQSAHGTLCLAVCACK